MASRFSPFTYIYSSDRTGGRSATRSIESDHMTKTILLSDVVFSVRQVANVQHHTVKMGPCEVLAAFRWRSVSPKTFFHRSSGY